MKNLDKKVKTKIAMIMQATTQDFKKGTLSKRVVRLKNLALTPFLSKKFDKICPSGTFLLIVIIIAEIAQLVERCLAKAKVAGSNPVFRSNFLIIFHFIHTCISQHKKIYRCYLMKSLVEEASSVSKAIENAWKRAEQPTEFSVRIHELPKKNMFGFTSKPAKIAIFFQEEYKKSGSHKTVSHTSSTNPIPAVSKPVTVKAQPKKAAEQPQSQKIAKPAPVAQKSPRAETAEPWSEEMVAYAENWLRELLQKLEIQNSKFQVTPQRYHLKISFTSPVFAEDEKNRAFFRNCAHLILQATRNSFKRPLKGFKAILTTEQP